MKHIILKLYEHFIRETLLTLKRLTIVNRVSWQILQLHDLGDPIAKFLSVVEIPPFLSLWLNSQFVALTPSVMIDTLPINDGNSPT